MTVVGVASFWIFPNPSIQKTVKLKNPWKTLTTKQGNEGFTVNPKVQTSKNHKIST